MTLKTLGMLAAGLLLALQALAQDVQNLQTIQREINVTEDVLAATLRERLGDGMNVNRVEGTYLPQQGVLLNINLSAPWFSIDHSSDGSDVHIDANLRLDEIPRMVHDILAELEINVAPFVADELSELKALRQEQRALREEQRSIRARLRQLRREQIRERGDTERAAIGSSIKELEIELEATEAAASALSRDIESQYDRLQEPENYTVSQKTDTVDTKVAVTSALCDAAVTLKSLQNERYVTAALKQSGSMTYITYSMERVRACQRQNLDAQALLESAWVYTQG